jgi:2-amino-4-hydroxy-6-hydroxymethyldihydropteridine diphosphokinase
MALAFIGLGSNLGDGRRNLRTAWEQLGRQPGLQLLALSCPYLSRPVNKPEWQATGRRLGEQSFTNAVGVLESRVTPLELLRILHEVEKNLGREREQSPDRTVDLDLLYYDDLVLEDPELTLPHPELAQRLFVLAPLEELAPDRPHPRLGLTTRQMRQRLAIGEETAVRRLDWDEELPV